MIISPSVFNKIKKVVFYKNEPPFTEVLWAKPMGDSFSFYMYDNGKWQPVGSSSVPTNISAFVNDVGYVTISNVADYLDEEGYVPGGGGSGEMNVIEAITFNGNAVPVDSSTKTAAITASIPTVPTISTDISSDSTSDTKTASPKAVKTFVEGKGYITDVSDKQDVIDSSHKLSADLIEDGTTNKVINVKPDWDAASGADAEILNKPTIPAAGIPSGGNAGQVLKKHSADPYDVEWANQSETLPSAYCTTSGSTAAKKANCSLYVTQANQYLQVLIGSANTYQGALTLNINSAGSKPIYINGTASSSSNYTLPNGTYFVFYDGTNYYFRTDGKIQGLGGTLVCTNSTSGLLKNDGTVSTDVAILSSDNGVGIVPEDGIRVETVSSGAAISVNPDVVTLISGAVGTAAITLQVPSDNLAHVWDILMTTDSSVSITLAMSATGSTIKYPADFAISASKSIEISVIGTGTTYYLRYGQFT